MTALPADVRQAVEKVVASAPPLSADQRDTIRRAFGSDVSGHRRLKKEILPTPMARRAS